VVERFEAYRTAHSIPSPQRSGDPPTLGLSRGTVPQPHDA
jgi:hypothetical protein